jgi:hypothetical protein
VKLDNGAFVTGEVTGAEGAVGGIFNECIKVEGEFECEFEIEFEVQPDDSGSTLGARVATDPDGAYSLLGPIGTRTLLLKATEGPLLGVAFKPVRDVNNALPGPNTVNIVAEAETEGTIRIQGTVFEPDGVTPAAGVDIIARYKDTNLIGRAYSDLGGNYVLVIK